MKHFLAIYHEPASGQTTSLTPEEQAKAMELWMAWKAKFDDQIIDMGAPLMGGQSQDADGAWTPSTKEVSGYSFVKAEDIEAAKAVFVQHPHLSWAPGCSIEIHETIPM